MVSPAASHGAFTISIDLELMWGSWDNPPRQSDLQVGTRERDICRRLVEVFERHSTRATWAVVGRLVERDGGFDGLRGSPEGWHAPDIVEAIEKSSIRHDIGSHGYAHPYFHSLPRADVRIDLERARAAQLRRGHTMTSFVFPRNQVAHLDLLAEFGVKVFRSIDQGLLRATEAVAPRARPLVNLLEKALAAPVPTVRPLRREFGLIELPSSLLLMSRGGIRSLVRPQAMRRKLLGGLRRAASKKEVFHLWFHPSNFYREEDLQFELLEATLTEARRLERAGDVKTMTMSDYTTSDAPQAQARS